MIVFRSFYPQKKQKLLQYINKYDIISLKNFNEKVFVLKISAKRVILLIVFYTNRMILGQRNLWKTRLKTKTHRNITR